MNYWILTLMAVFSLASCAVAPRSTQTSVAQFDRIPKGDPVPGKPGFCYSPYDRDSGIVEISGMSPGTKVRCPYTGNAFLVPSPNERGDFIPKRKRNGGQFAGALAAGLSSVAAQSQSQVNYYRSNPYPQPQPLVIPQVQSNGGSIKSFNGTVRSSNGDVSTFRGTVY